MAQETVPATKTHKNPLTGLLKIFLFILLMLVLFALFVGLLTEISQSATLDEVKARDKLNCGVNTGIEGFALKDEQGLWQGFNVDFCKAIAVATLGDANKVNYVPLTAQDRFDRLKAGDVDVLIRNTTWTMEREVAMPLRFVGINYFDGQGFMVPKSLGVNSVATMGQAAICFVSGTTTQTNVQDYFRERDLTYTPVVFNNNEEAMAAYEAGKCDSITGDQSQLYALRLRLKKPDEHIVLNDVISKEPLGLMIRQGDEQWTNIVRWTLFALINAEELEVKGSSVDDLTKTSKRPAVLRLLGVESSLGPSLGLAPDWSAQVIKATGNYSEIFERNLGKASRLKIERGQNALWNAGGLLYVPPLR